MTNTAHNPTYPLKDVKKLIEDGKVNFNWETIHAFEDFGWKSEEIKKCILKLTKNHFYKSEQHRIEGIKVDVYKAVNIMEGNNIYTYFYIDPYFDRLVVYSFQEL